VIRTIHPALAEYPIRSHIVVWAGQIRTSVTEKMPRKRSPSIIPRFSGHAGRRNLFAAICAQQSVAGDAPLARRLINAGSLHELPEGRTISRQGDTDNDIYMIVAGSVGIVINKREVAVRSSGTHVGEMALLEPTARRSATMVTKERTVVLKLSEVDVTRIARRYPDYWRRLAVELGSRLRERTKFIREPNSVARVFIGSSSEALAEATYLSRMFTRRDVTCDLWTEGVFQLSQTTVEDLVRVSTECDFAVLFLTPDDMTSSRGHRSSSPRDNVVFELGLFMGALGRDRTYIVVPRGIAVRLPTDLLGVTHAPYDRARNRSLGRRLRQASQMIWQRISTLGPK
jgi:CRP/FNR family cyclic AMP-dependent transcriptional regulator